MSVRSMRLRQSKSASVIFVFTETPLVLFNCCFYHTNCCSDWNIRVQDFGSGAAPRDSVIQNVTPDTGGCGAGKADALPASGSRAGGAGPPGGPSGMRSEPWVPRGQTRARAETRCAGPALSATPSSIRPGPARGRAGRGTPRAPWPAYSARLCHLLCRCVCKHVPIPMCASPEFRLKCASDDLTVNHGI